MMLALVVTLQVETDKQEHFESIMTELARTTREREPNVVLYELCKSQSNPSEYRILEVYKSQEDLDSHLQTEWFKAAGPKMVSCFSAKPLMEHYNTIA